jgi:hypothetical protein
MLSKKRADLQANELLKVAREERDSGAARGTRLLVLLFPELSACAPARRWSALVEARAEAQRERLVFLANLTAVVPVTALIAAALLDWEPRFPLVVALIAAIVLGRCVDYARTRSHLRSMLKSRTRSITDDVAPP